MRKQLTIYTLMLSVCLAGAATVFGQGASGGGAGSGGGVGTGTAATGSGVGSGLNEASGARNGSGIGDGLRSGIGGEPNASGAGGTALRAGRPRTMDARPPLGSPNVGNVGAPSTIGGAAFDQHRNLTGTNAPASASAGQNSSPPGRATGRLSNDWRYVYEHGWHWYWMPDNSWNIWNGSAWQRYSEGMQNRTERSQMQMRGYRQAPAANSYRAYDEQNMQRTARPPHSTMRAGTRALGPRRYSPTAGPQQGLPPQETTPLPRSPAQSAADVLEEVPDASGVTVP